MFYHFFKVFSLFFEKLLYVLLFNIYIYIMYLYIRAEYYTIMNYFWQNQQFFGSALTMTIAFIERNGKILQIIMCDTMYKKKKIKKKYIRNGEKAKCFALIIISLAVTDFYYFFYRSFVCLPRFKSGFASIIHKSN